MDDPGGRSKTQQGSFETELPTITVDIINLPPNCSNISLGITHQQRAVDHTGELWGRRKGRSRRNKMTAFMTDIIFQDNLISCGLGAGWKEST